jgi:class 3 adenylate cyclase
MLKSGGLIGIAAVSVLLNAAFVGVLLRMKRRAELLRIAREKATLDLQNLQQAFHQFAPQRVVEDVIKRGASTSGETRSVTVLFSDIVEFTALSESLSPETLVRILNGYFEAASTAVTRHGGHVAKFIGDGVMAIFGAPESNAWHAMDAVIAKPGPASIRCAHRRPQRKCGRGRGRLAGESRIHRHRRRRKYRRAHREPHPQTWRRYLDQRRCPSRARRPLQIAAIAARICEGKSRSGR